MLVVTGLFLIFGLLHVINLAHAGLMAVGVYAQVSFRGHDIPFWPAVSVVCARCRRRRRADRGGGDPSPLCAAARHDPGDVGCVTRRDPGDHPHLRPREQVPRSADDERDDRPRDAVFDLPAAADPPRRRDRRRPRPGRPFHGRRADDPRRDVERAARAGARHQHRPRSPDHVHRRCGVRRRRRRAARADPGDRPELRSDSRRRPPSSPYSSRAGRCRASCSPASCSARRRSSSPVTSTRSGRARSSSASQLCCCASVRRVSHFVAPERRRADRCSRRRDDRPPRARALAARDATTSACSRRRSCTESLAVSLDLVWGYTGIPDLGHALWFGIGALAVGMASTDARPDGLRDLETYPALGPHLVGLVIGMVAAGAVAAVVGLLSFSQREADPFYIAVVTLALTVVAGTVYGQLTAVHRRRQRHVRLRLPRAEPRRVVLRHRRCSWSSSPAQPGARSERLRPS